MKIRSVGAELFDADRRTEGQKDTTKLRGALRSFVNVPQKMFPYTELTTVISTGSKLCFLGSTNLNIRVYIHFSFQKLNISKHGYYYDLLIISRGYLYKEETQCIIFCGLFLRRLQYQTI